MTTNNANPALDPVDELLADIEASNWNAIYGTNATQTAPASSTHPVATNNPPANTAPTVTVLPKKSWFRRHWLFSVLGGTVLAVAGIANHSGYNTRSAWHEQDPENAPKPTYVTDIAENIREGLIDLKEEAGHVSEQGSAALDGSATRQRSFDNEREIARSHRRHDAAELRLQTGFERDQRTFDRLDAVEARVAGLESAEAARKVADETTKSEIKAAYDLANSAHTAAMNAQAAADNANRQARQNSQSINGLHNYLEDRAAYDDSLVITSNDFTGIGKKATTRTTNQYHSGPKPVLPSLPGDDLNEMPLTTDKYFSSPNPVADYGARVMRETTPVPSKQTTVQPGWRDVTSPADKGKFTVYLDTNGNAYTVANDGIIIADSIGGRSAPSVLPAPTQPSCAFNPSLGRVVCNQ